MRLVLGGVNGHYLRNVTENAKVETEEVLAAVAYANEASLLFDWCWENNIPLTYYGRLDDTVAVALRILKSFLERRSARFVCHLVEHHHAKVIWWRGFGVYIGSANLTHSAWYNNVEAGCFFEDTEIDSEMESDLRRLFLVLDKHSTPLSDEVVDAMRRRSGRLVRPNAEDFWESTSFTRWNGLAHIEKRSAASERRRTFLEEWYLTLQHLRDIGEEVSKRENQPDWISPSAPIGAQTDQFLHAFYYQCTFVGNRANYSEFFEKNKNRRDEALAETLEWWRQLQTAPSSEAKMLNITAPFLRSALERERIEEMSYDNFQDICSSVHSIRDYARRVANGAVGLPEKGGGYTIEVKIAALSERVWNERASAGSLVKELLLYILYGGLEEQLPERLWQGVSDPKWKLPGLGISALGEVVGWALPDRFPPRNGRTSKALKALGYDVTVHV